MIWNDPNQIALFAAIGQWASAIASFLAVVVAVSIAIWSSKNAQKQSRRIRYDSVRPALIISGEDPVHTLNERNRNDDAYISRKNGHYFQIITMQPGEQGWIDWNASDHFITLQNVGTGVAFNVMSAIFGPESLVDHRDIVDASKNDYWHVKINVLTAGESNPCKYVKSLQHLLQGTINGYSLLAPAQPLIDRPFGYEANAF